MTAPNIHPDRAALFSKLHRPSATPAAKPEPLPPDVEAARKTRINNDLIDVLKRPCPENTTPSIQGIGLYTHVAGPPAAAPQFPRERFTQKPSDPVFLQIGGPRRLFKEGNGLEGPISEDVKKAWKVVQEAVDKEEEHLSRGGMSLEQLQERYGALQVPDGYASTQPMPRPQSQLEQTVNHPPGMAMTDVHDGAGDVGQQGRERRLSLEAGLARDVVMGGTEQDSRGSATRTSTGNTYEAARDPRLRGRRRETEPGI